MTIRFMCPNGHQLSASEDRAGKAGQCPKCKAEFLIPSLEDFAAAEEDEPAPPEKPAEKPLEKPADKSVGSDSQAPRSVEKPGSGLGTGSSAGSSAGSGAKKMETFAFLCPNGHKLNGPITLKGKPGKCPHCGAKFLVPADDETEPEAPPEPPAPPSPPAAPVIMPSIVTSGVSKPGSEILTLNITPEPEEEEIPFGAPAGIGPPIPRVSPPESEPEMAPIIASVAPPESVPTAKFASEEDSPTDIGGMPVGHELGRIAVRLWEQREEGDVLELQLPDGPPLTARHFSRSLSQGSYAVIAERQADNSYVISSVRWDAVQKLSLKRAKSLPRGFFD